MLPKEVLVPTDFSEAAEVALDYAVELASRLDATIHLLHAVDLRGLGGEVGLTSSVLRDLVESSQVAADKLVARRQGQATFAPARTEVGDARMVIETEAKRIGADLIAMGTHGRRGFKRLLLGSVAESVARIAPCPVLLIRGAE